MENSLSPAALIAVAVSMFLFGSIIVRDCSGIRKHKQELKNIQQEYQILNENLDQIYLNSQIEQEQIYSEIEQAYLNFDTIQQKKAEVTQSINSRNRNQKNQKAKQKAKRGKLSGFKFNQ